MSAQVFSAQAEPMNSPFHKPGRQASSLHPVPGKPVKGSGGTGIRPGKGGRAGCFPFLRLVRNCLILMVLFTALAGFIQPVRAVNSPSQHTGPEEQQIQASSSTSKGLGLTPEEREFLHSHPVIRVGNEDDWPPFDFSEHGVPKGYAIEHLELLGRKLGISFEYVNGYTWAELLNLFRQGEVDLLPSLWISESRKEFMLFTEPFLKLPYVIVTSRKDSSIEAFQDLYGKIVAAPKGYIQEEVLTSSFPQVKVHQVNNPLEGLKAVTYGKADAYIGYRGVVDYIIATRFFTDLQIVGETRAPGLGPQGLYIGVRQDMPELRDVLQKAMDSVSRKQKIELSRKWISVDQESLPDLSIQEAAYLQDHPTLKVDNLQNWPPFNFAQNGKPKGFCIDYLNLLGEKLGVSVEFVTGPTWNEFMAMLDRGELDLLCDVVETESRRQSIAFTQPYFSIFSGIVVRQGSDRPGDMEDLAGKRVVVPEDFYYQEILEKYYPDIRVMTVDTTLDCLKTVSSGKADAALAEKPVFDYLITKHFLSDLVSVPIMDSVHFENTPVSIGVEKDRTVLRDILQKAMDTVTEDEMSAIYNRWLEAGDQVRQLRKVPLTQEEKRLLKGMGNIRMCAHPGLLPFDGVDSQGRHTGIVADIMGMVSERIGVPITLVPTGSWEESLQVVGNGTCDILSCVHKSPGNVDPLVYSEPYFDSVSVIVARDGEPYIQDMKVLSGKKAAVVQGNPITQYLRENFPQVTIQPMPDLEQALKAVSTGKADVAIDSLQMVSYRIHEQGLYDLKIAGQTPYKDFLRIGISNRSSELKPILDKALDSISSQDISRITREWLSIRYEHGFNTGLLWKILIGVALVIALVMYWNRKLSRLNRELALAHEDLGRKSTELEKLSETDRLTGLTNRMKLEEILEQECRRSSRSRTALSVIMLDVDHFKAINDTYGHHAGDQVLRDLADILEAHVRSIDTVGRWGGEEFLIICPGTTVSGARTLAEKLRKSLEVHDFPVVGNCTCSLGISAYQWDDQAEDIVIRADQAMYRAKEKGRNRVEVLS